MTPIEKTLCGLEKAIADFVEFAARGIPQRESGPDTQEFTNVVMLRASFNVLKQEVERLLAGNRKLIEAARLANHELRIHSYYGITENAAATDAIRNLDTAVNETDNDNDPA